MVIIQKIKNLTLNYSVWLGCLVLFVKISKVTFSIIPYNVCHTVGTQ